MSIYQHTGIAGSHEIRPREDIDPRDKAEKPQWSLAFARYIYSKYLSNQSAISVQEYLDFTENRRYGFGCQDTQKYKKVFWGDRKAPSNQTATSEPDFASMQSSREGWVNMEFDSIFSPMPKFILNIIGKFQSQEHDISIEAQDEKSVNKKEDEKYRALAENYLKDLKLFVQEKLALPPLPGEEQGGKILPANIKEAEMFKEFGSFKLPYEIGMEMLNEYVMNVSDQVNLKDDILRELLINNIAATVSREDKITMLVKDELVNVENLIIENSNDRMFRDITWWAMQEYVSLGQIREATGLEYDELLKLANNYKGVLGNPSAVKQIGEFGAMSNSTVNIHRLPNGSFTFDSFKVPVLFWRVLSYDEEYNTVRVREDGTEISVYEPYRQTLDGEYIKPKVYDSEKRKTFKKAMNTVYEGRWIIGSEVVYNYGRMVNIPFDYALNRPKLGINISRLPGNSIVRNSIPVLDQIFMAFLRLQNAIAKAAPPGLKIEYGALEGMTFEGKKFTPKDSLTLYSHTGSILYRFTPMVSGAPQNSGKPIEELRGGLGTAGADAVVILDLLYNQLAEVTGVDRISSVSKSPTVDQTKGVTEMAVATTLDTLRPIYGAYLSIKTQQVENNTLMLQSVLLSPEGQKRYKRIIGEGYINAIVAADKTAPIEWGFKAVARPNDALKNNVIQAAQVAMTGGKNGTPAIQLNEYMFIIEHLNTMAGIKFARAYIAFKEGERDKKDAELQKQNIQLQNQGLQQLEVIKAKATSAQIEQQRQLQAEKIANQLEADMILEEAKHIYKMEEMQLQDMGTHDLAEKKMEQDKEMAQSKMQNDKEIAKEKASQKQSQATSTK